MGALMTDKRYQVFISSTYKDLKEERQAAHEAILQGGDFPVGMEAFPAADDEQFEFIKSIIDKSDYYIVIVGGRYGSLASDGLSYTEKEYRYAKSQGIPILAIVHNDRGDLPTSKSETSDSGQEKLSAFIAELSTDRMITEWNTVDGLRYKVYVALENAKSSKPRRGWVRGDAAASLELLTEINELRKANNALQKLVDQSEINAPQLTALLPDLPDFSDTINIDIYEQNNLSILETIQGSWLDLFPIFYDSIIESLELDPNWDRGQRYDEEIFIRSFASRICMQIYSTSLPNLYISDQDKTALESYYQEVGLMLPDGPYPFSDRAQQLHRRLSINSKAVPPNIISLKPANFDVLEKETKDTDEIPF